VVVGWACWCLLASGYGLCAWGVADPPPPPCHSRLTAGCLTLPPPPLPPPTSPHLSSPLPPYVTLWDGLLR
jgi:hypothetical protein